MNTIALVGGSGQVGRALIPDLVQLGAIPRVLSRRERPENAPASIQWSTVDYGDKTRRSLAAALSGVDAVVLTVGGAREPDIVRAVAQECAPETHLIYLSIVGIERLPMSYYRVKLRSERIVQSGGQPWTILRATQFHSLVWGVLAGLAKLPGVMFVPRIRVQSVAVADVSARLAELTQGPPRGFAPEIGGPEIYDLESAAERFLAARGKKRRIKTFTVPGKLRRGLEAGANLTPDHADGTSTFDDYVERRIAAER